MLPAAISTVIADKLHTNDNKKIRRRGKGEEDALNHASNFLTIISLLPPNSSMDTTIIQFSGWIVYICTKVRSLRLTLSLIRWSRIAAAFSRSFLPWFSQEEYYDEMFTMRF